jgi:hypothetical protein
MARLCRGRAQQVGQPSMCGSQVARHLPGVTSLQRATELATGAKAAPAEIHAAVALARASAIYDRVLKEGSL